MMHWEVRWQDRALLYMHKLSRETGVKLSIKTKLIFIKLCEYALKNGCWQDGKLTFKLSVTEMCNICKAARSCLIEALKTLKACGAITRIPSGNSRISPITIINFIDGQEENEYE